MKANERIVEWKKTPHDPLTHDQWNSVTHDMFIRKVDDYNYDLYVKAIRKGTFPNLTAAKNAAESYVRL